MNTLLSRLEKQLLTRKTAGNLRILRTKTQNMIDFCSNDYLGLSQSKILQKNTETEISQIENYQLGATGSRLVSGTHPYMCVLEAYLADLFRGESCLLFNSGYSANSALIATISQKNDILICDELVHASLREGTKLSFAKNYYFKHNDLADLAKKLTLSETTTENQTGEKFVIIESVYSMDGDFGDILGISDVCKQFSAHLIVDEAHSTGIFGENGNGLFCEKFPAITTPSPSLRSSGARFPYIEGEVRGGFENIISENDVFARIYTFGKAIGTHGACIVGSKILTDYLVNFARGFIYTTAPTLHSLATVKCAFEMIKNNPNLQEKLFENIAFFRENFREIFNQNKTNLAKNIILKESFTPIQILQIGGNERTKALAVFLQKENFDVRPILAPTVKEGEEILRICLHVFNTKKEILGLINGIWAFFNHS